MKFEMDSLHANQVWDLVELHKGVKPIGCKFYKMKRGLNRKVETFKARLVAKGYT